MIRKTIKILSEYWKGITAVVSIVSTIWVTSAIYHREKDNKEEFQTEVRDYIQESKEQTADTDMRLERIERTLMDQNNQIADMREENKTTRRVLVESVAKNPGFTKEDYDYLINILYDIKKNGTTYK